MPTSSFPSVITGVTIETATNGALSGDGSSGNKLAVGVDGVTIDVNGSNQLEALNVPAVDATYVTVTDETGTLTASRRLVAGDNVTLDASVAGQLTVAASGNGAATSPLTITTDGTVGGYALVAPQTVVVGGVAYPAPGKWVNGLPTVIDATILIYVDLAGVTKTDGNSINVPIDSITTLGFPTLKVVDRNFAISGGDGSLTSFDLSALQAVSGVVSIGGNSSNLSSLTEISLPSLTSVSGSVNFNSIDWSALTSISAPLLATAAGVTIDSQSAPLLTAIAFPALTDSDVTIAPNDTSSLSGLASIDLSALAAGQVIIGGNSAADLSSLSSLSLKPASTVELSLGGMQTGWTTMDLSAVTSMGSISLGDGGVAAFTGTNLTTIDLSNLTTIQDLNLGQPGDDLSSLASIDLSSLTSVTDGDLRIANGVAVENLTELDLSSVQTVGGTLGLVLNGASAGLASIDLSGLQSVGGDFGVSGSNDYGTQLPALTTVTLTSALKSVGGDFLVTQAALSQANVDALLVRLAALDGTGGTTSYDNHTVIIAYGTTSPPGAAGDTAKATLEGRGNTVTVNREFAITAAAADPANTVTVSGDQTATFVNGAEFLIFGSTGNDGVWVVDNAAFGAGVTVITVTDLLPDSTGDGTIRVATTIG